MDWCDLVPFIVHPTKVAIIEAMLWIDEPCSAVDIQQMHGQQISTSVVSYHLRSLAVDHPILSLYREEPVRGAWKKLYYFRNRTPASKRRRQTE